MADSARSTGPSRARRRTPVWLTAPLLTVAALSVASGIGQFAVTTVIGDVAAAFGEPSGDDALAQIGLPATSVGLALAVIRLASLGALPTSALADRWGRRRMLLISAAIGLGLTSLSALAPSFWWYVALVALSRPALSTVNALDGVIAAEETTSRHRSWAIALVAAAYGLGAGIIAVGRGLLPGWADFRVVMLLAIVPLVALPWLARHVREPRIARGRTSATGIPGRLPRAYVGRVVILTGLTGMIAVATGPGFTYLFVYGERVLDASPLALSVLVLGAGPAGLAGLLLGRWAADRLGRRGSALVAMAATGGAVAYAYAGGLTELMIGYLAAITASSAFAPPVGALVVEVVPTRIRGTVVGWETVAGVLGAVLGLLSFGVLADLTGGFAAASRSVGVVVALASAGFLLLPETRGVELDDVA